MLDIRATHYVSPLSEVDFESVPLTVHIVNVADETGLVTGKFRVYNDTTGLLIHTSDVAPLSLAAGAAVDVSALTDFDPPAPADDVYFVIFDGNASNALVPDGINFALGAFYFDVKPVGMGPAPAAHAGTHENGGSDELEVSDLGTSELDDTLVLHPNGAGGVEWEAGGGGGTPAAHAGTHENGGSDELEVSDLGTAELDDTLVLKPDGAGGVEWEASPAGVTDHGALTGLGDDDHTQYLKTDGTRALTGTQEVAGGASVKTSLGPYAIKVGQTAGVGYGMIVSDDNIGMQFYWSYPAYYGVAFASNSFIPTADNVMSLGALTHRWLDVFISGRLDSASDSLRIRTAKTPATSGAAGNAGDICWDSDYIYVCTAANTWKRAAIATW